VRAAAARLTVRPWHGFWLSAMLSVASVWIGIGLAYAIPKAPASFTIMTTAAGFYALAALAGRAPGRRFGAVHAGAS